MFFEDAFIIANEKNILQIVFYCPCPQFKSFHSGSRTWHYYVFLRMSTCTSQLCSYLLCRLSAALEQERAESEARVKEAVEATAAEQKVRPVPLW